MTGAITQIHATAIALDDRRCALILGPSGAGKSDLALRCILQGVWIDGRHLTATLVADDQVIIERQRGQLVATVPEPIAGLIEVRGMGLVRLPHLSPAAIVMAVELAEAGAIARFPDPTLALSLHDLTVPLMRVAAFEASTHLKVLLALATGLPRPT
jgi:serine kinase of HPr protein (carbohydrate metabolism regulator)